MIPVFFSYLLKLSLSLAMVYLFYRLVLQNLTFYHWNRWYLLGFTALSFLIPLVDVSAFWADQQQTPLPAVTQYIPPVTAFAGTHLVQPEPAAPAFDVWDWLLLALMIGTGGLLVRTGLQALSFLQIRQRARLISGQDIKIYQVDADILPFSFGRSVFLNRALHREQDLPEIIRHELVHAQQIHTADIIWMELVCMLNWYNPFVWLLRRQLRQNLEYIADSQVLQAGIDKKHYQYLLLQVTGGPAFHLGSQFNFSSLKKRIMMMNKMPSSRPQLARFLFLLPLLAVLLLAFRSVEKPARLNKLEAGAPDYFGMTVQEAVVRQENQAAQKENKAAQKKNKAARKESKAAQKESKAAQKESKAAQKENQIRRQENQALHQENQTLQIRKNGPPVSPLQDTVKAKLASRPFPLSKRPAKVIMPEDYQNFMQRNPQVKGLQWKQDNHFQQVIIQLRSGKQETYDLNDAAGLAAVEKKYGKLPAPPPPPPAPKRVPAPAGAPKSPPAPPAAPAPALPAAPTAPAAPAPQKLPPPPPPPKTDNMGAYNTKDPNRLPEDYKAFLKRNPQVEQLIWYWEGSGIPNKPVQVVVIQKSGAQENYHYNSDSEMAGAERKYGKLPWPAPPVARYDVPPPVPERPEKPKGQE